MRSFLIACVALLTLLTFYSALWFKSEVIEADITTRVTEDLTAANAANVGIDVDGRHVTLSGVVYDEAAETAALDTADSTYGALGPIDGLTFLQDSGFLKAVKTDAGITLTGTVPSEDARAALLASAAEATEGAVEDKLTIAGPQAAWQDQAGFGLAQLSGLSAGAMTLAADSFTLSGMARDDAAPINDALTGQEGWVGFVSSPAVEMGLSDEVTRLRATVDDREGRIGLLSGNLTGLQADLETVTGQRDSLQLQRDTLSATVAGLTAERASVAAERDTAIGDLETLRASLDSTQTTRASLAAELAETKQNLNGANGRVEELTANIAALDGEKADLMARLGTTEGRVADLQARVDLLDPSLKSADAEIQALTDMLGQKDTTIASLETQLENVSSGDAEAAARIAALNNDVAARDTTISDLTGTIAVRDATIEGLQGQVANGEETIAGLQGQVADRDTTIEGLQGQVADRDTTIAGLQGQVTDRDTTIAGLQGQVQNAETEISDLRVKALSATQSLSDNEVKIATLMTDLTGAQNTAQERGQQVQELTATVAQRDETIAGLRSRPAAPATATPAVSMAQVCGNRANALLEGAEIRFGSGNARLDGRSVALLERLSGVALACVGDDLGLEIGGHTDAQGSDAANQRLSERRAQTILAFLAERGVPTSGLNAVGYGESRPIADNATPAGRAQNRRITFDWQAR